MISADLRGKKVLVTGGASGIGLATVELFARSGATVALNDLPSNERAARAVERLTGEGLHVLEAAADVGDGEQAVTMVTRAVGAMGGLDYLVNNAGTPGTRVPIAPAELDRLSDAFWDRLLSVNLLAPFRCTRAAAPFLKAAQGAVVNTSSSTALIGGGSSAAYSASKAALNNLTRQLARGLAPEVRVNAIAPSLVDSNWEVAWPEDELQRHIATTPLKRKGDPLEYAEVILFLCAGASFINGQTILVDGGEFA